MGEKEIVLIVVLIVLAVFLHIFSVCGWYRRGFDEGYEKGLASRKEPVDGPKVIRTVNDIVKLRAYVHNVDEFKEDCEAAVIARLDEDIFRQIRPFIRKSARKAFDGSTDAFAEINVVDKRGEVLED